MTCTAYWYASREGLRPRITIRDERGAALSGFELPPGKTARLEPMPRRPRQDDPRRDPWTPATLDSPLRSGLSRAHRPLV